MKVVVTGGAGRLGRYAIRELRETGYEVVSIDVTGVVEEASECHVVDLTTAKPLYRILEGAEGVMQLARERFPYTEQNLYDPVTRTWRLDDTSGDADKFNRNVAMTYNVLAVAAVLGVRRVVIGSSLAVYGFYYPTRFFYPDYLPIDEDSPRRPQDPYGISKLVGEDIAWAFGQESGMEVVCLRFAGIATDTVYDRLKKRREDPLARGVGSFWSYIDAQDAAIACRLALEVPLNGPQAFNICAPTTFLRTPTDDLLQQHLPQVRRLRPGTEPTYCCYDPGKAERLLQFRAANLLQE